MTALWIYFAAQLICVVCAVEWAAARTYHRLFRFLTVTTTAVALITAIAAATSGYGFVVMWYGIGCAVIFVGYGVIRAVTRKW